MMRAVGTIALCGALVLGASSPSLAAAPPTPKVTLKVTVAVKNGPTKGAWLNCSPDGGTHPSAHAACELLRKVKGDPAKINVSPKAAAACGKEVEPRAVMILGKWYGKTVQWGKVYTNACTMKAGLGTLLAI
ncbi:SSI family serine proteinase inhibitor [Nonomuraea sp. NPDC001636]|uniref:SSI family serine proteinase inhibitor n=1 Tax=Nonomuraea sp. NPDC001636 TaxID=3154391 RepID=UPI00331F42C5